MKFQAEINGQTRAVEIRRDGDRAFVRVDDRDYELEVSQPEPGICVFKHLGRVYETFAAPTRDQNGLIEVDISAKKIDVVISDPRRLRGARNEHSNEQGAAEIRSAMPGKVVRILAAAGQQVEKSDGLIVVEAMKMQNEIKAPKSGSVKSVNVEEGATVNAGEILMVLE